MIDTVVTVLPGLCCFAQLVAWLGGAAAVNGDAALLDFTCPGTVAAKYKLCKSATDAGGWLLPGSSTDSPKLPIVCACLTLT